MWSKRTLPFRIIKILQNNKQIYHAMKTSEVFAIDWVVMNWTKYCCPALKMKDISSLMVKLVMHIAIVKLTHISAWKVNSLLWIISLTVQLVCLKPLVCLVPAGNMDCLKSSLSALLLSNSAAILLWLTMM